MPNGKKFRPPVLRRREEPPNYPFLEDSEGQEQGEAEKQKWYWWLQQNRWPWETPLEPGEPIESPALKGLEYAVYPFTYQGMLAKATEEEREKYGIATAKMTAPYRPPEEKKRGWLPGGEFYKEYQALPFLEQLGYEAPSWAMTLLAPSATAMRAGLATKPGVLPAVARGALLPAEAVETTIAVAVKQTIGKVVPKVFDRLIVAATRRELRKAATVAGIKLTPATERELLQVYKQAFQAHLESELRAWTARTGRELPTDTSIKTIEYVSNRASPKWAADRMMSALGKGEITPKLIQAAADKVAKEAIRPVPALLDEWAKVKPPAEPFATPTQLPEGITKVPEVLTPIEGGVAYLPPTLDVATNAQKVYAHKIAEQKGFNEKARRKLAKLYTGKRSMLDMTEEEAQTFIEVLGALPKARYEIRAGKRVWVAPTIPRTKAVVPENYFNIEFKQPTPIRFFTAQDYYTQKLGLKPLVRPLELAKQRFDLEHQAFANAVEKQIEKLNKIAGTSIAEKIASKVKNVPTRAERTMRDLLDQHEEPPAFLSDSEREIFTWFRNLNRTILNGENEVRALLGIDPIPYRKAYVRHIAEGMALEMLQGIHPFPEGLKYWSERLVGKKVFNPMEFQRQIADDLEQYFTKDLAYATKSMLWTGLKEIHLSRPLRAFTEQLTAFTKDLPAYENLSAEEIARVRKMSVMPASTRKWLENYVNQVIKGQPTGLDMEINRLLMREGLRGVVDKMLAPFGRSLGQFPLTKLGQVTGRTIMAAVLGPLRVKLIIRNKHQLMQNLALYTLKANIRGVLTPANEQMQELLAQSTFLKGYTGLEELPAGLMNKLEKIWHGAYRWSAVSNAHSAMKVAYWDTLELIANPKYKTLGWADPQRTYKEPKGFLYPSEKQKMLYEMEWGAGATQYSYIPMGMPELFRHKTLVPLTRLQSWWMNYFFRFHREALSRALTGKTGYGARLPWSRRLAYLKYLFIGGSILTALGYKRSFLMGVVPDTLSPAMQMALGLYGYVSADNDYGRKKAVRQIYYSWKAFVPGSLTFSDFNDVWTGEKPLISLFFYKGGLPYPQEETKGKFRPPVLRK